MLSSPSRSGQSRVISAPAGDRNPISFQWQDYGYISVVAVTPAYRRRGLATALIQRVAAHWRSQGLASLRIDVHADNLPAVRAYETPGFQVYETREEVNGRDRASRDEVVRPD
jgi:ribosomal protein S18 acetylase RimI-like enzyme